MEIVIGAAPRIGQPGKRMVPKTAYVEAQVLNMRAPRRRRENLDGGQPDRRHPKANADPAAGRVLLLMVPEGYHIPQDLDSGNYRVFLRVVPKKK